MVPVYVDASSAILLQKTDLFDMLPHTFKTILAKSVFKEITRHGYQGADFFIGLGKKNCFLIQQVNEKTIYRDLCKSSLDAGEKDTINLFLEQNQGFIITDDGKAARFCDRHQLPFINALLIPKLFWFTDLMDKKTCFEKMNLLYEIGRYSKKVKQFAFDCTKYDLQLFCSKIKPDERL